MAVPQIVVTMDGAVAGYAEPVTPPLTMQLARGEIVGLTGANGVGKSTFIRLLIGADARCHQGRAWCLENAQLAVLEQVPPPALRQLPCSGRELVRLYAGSGAPVMPHWAIHLLDKRLGVLSGGQLQTLLLCACFMRGQDLLIFDEPTHSLDRRGLAYLAQRLHERSPQLAVLVVSHEENFLRDIGARVLRLEKS